MIKIFDSKFMRLQLDTSYDIIVIDLADENKHINKSNLLYFNDNAFSKFGGITSKLDFDLESSRESLITIGVDLV